MKEIKTLGKQLLGEFMGCKADLDDVPAIKKMMEDAALFSNATIVDSVFHHFSPWGVSGVVVIAESHLAIHTWPEYEYAAVDVFTCGDTVNPWDALNFLKKAFRAEQTSIKEVTRGNFDLISKRMNKREVVFQAT